MQFFAHSKQDKDGNPTSKDEWEPLFTPFGKGADQCQREHCPKCECLESYHGHLNKVAWWAAKFAAEMFPEGKDREAARQWGYLAGLWHDLGKFAPKWQTYLATKADPHTAEVTGKIDHSTVGAKHAVSASPLGHLMATAIAEHHSALLDVLAAGACLVDLIPPAPANSHHRQHPPPRPQTLRPPPFPLYYATNKP